MLSSLSEWLVTSSTCNQHFLKTFFVPYLCQVLYGQTLKIFTNLLNKMIYSYSFSLQMLQNVFWFCGISFPFFWVISLMNRSLNFNVAEFIFLFLYGTYPKAMNIFSYNLIYLPTFTINFLRQIRFYLYGKVWVERFFHLPPYGWPVISACFIELFCRVVTLNLEWACPRIIKELLQTASSPLPHSNEWILKGVCMFLKEDPSGLLFSLCTSLRTTAIEGEYCVYGLQRVAVLYSFISQNCSLALFRANWQPS